MTGFGLATALMLCTPVLNLFFRPVVLVAASRVQASFERSSEPTLETISV
jgi:hypothetical protein